MKAGTAPGSSKESEIDSLNQLRIWHVSFSMQMSAKQLLTTLSTLSVMVPDELAKIRGVRVRSTST